MYHEQIRILILGLQIGVTGTQYGIRPIPEPNPLVARYEENT
jgi:hypothetical protein